MDKTMYEVTFEDVTKGMDLILTEKEMKDRGAEFVGYTDEYYDAGVTGFYCHKVYELNGNKYCIMNAWKFRDQ